MDLDVVIVKKLVCLTIKKQDFKEAEKSLLINSWVLFTFILVRFLKFICSINKFAEYCTIIKYLNSTTWVGTSEEIWDTCLEF